MLGVVGVVVVVVVVEVVVEVVVVGVGVRVGVAPYALARDLEGLRDGETAIVRAVNIKTERKNEEESLAHMTTFILTYN